VGGAVGLVVAVLKAVLAPKRLQVTPDVSLHAVTVKRIIISCLFGNTTPWVEAIGEVESKHLPGLSPAPEFSNSGWQIESKNLSGDEMLALGNFIR